MKKNYIYIYIYILYKYILTVNKSIFYTKDMII